MNAEELHTVVELATKAPSVHNTQPWRFSARSDLAGDIVGIDVFADRDRSLDVIDPEARDLHLSCGAAIEFARIGVRSLARACTVHLLPDAGDTDHLAWIEIGGAEPVRAEEVRLLAAVPARYTARERFDDTPVPPALVADLEHTVSETGAWLRVLGHKADEVTLAVLLAKSDDIERHDDRYVAELTNWLNRPQGSGDGIPAAAVVPTHERASAFQLREDGGRPAGRRSNWPGRRPRHTAARRASPRVHRRDAGRRSLGLADCRPSPRAPPPGSGSGRRAGLTDDPGDRGRIGTRDAGGRPRDPRSSSDRLAHGVCTRTSDHAAAAGRLRARRHRTMRLRP